MPNRPDSTGPGPLQNRPIEMRPAASLTGATASFRSAAGGRSPHDLEGTGPVEGANDGFWTGRFRAQGPESSFRPLLIALGVVVLVVGGILGVSALVGGGEGETLPPAEITVLSDDQGAPEAVAAVGLEPELVDELRRELRDGAAWESLFAVEAAGEPLSGSWQIEDDSVIFYPRRPFEKGVDHRVTWGGAPALDFAPEKAGAPTPTYVLAVHPTSDMVPENLTRMELEMSGPMGDDDPLEHLALEVGDGEIVGLRELGIEPRWNEDRTRLVIPLTEGEGESDRRRGVLEDGRRYRLLVDRGWRDAEGRLMAPVDERVFLARARDREAPQAGEVRVQAPSAEQAPVVVELPEPLDRASLRDAVSVVEVGSDEPVEGESRLSNTDTRWSFVPAQPWKADGRYAVRLAETLVDLAGNPLDTGSTGAAVLPFRLEAEGASSAPGS